MRLILTALISLLPAVCQGFDWPLEDTNVDRLLREQSKEYRFMAEEVAQRQGYSIETSEEPTLGDVTVRNGRAIIRLNPTLKGARRITVLIWEMANAYQRPRFDEIDRRARTGVIQSHVEFGLRMEMVEYDSFRHHRRVLEDLQTALVPITPDFLFFINPALSGLDAYEIPYVHDYIEAQGTSGHTRHYERWYYHQIGQSPPF